MSFHNKVVLVTGGSSGIGADAAIAFAKEGANVAIVGRNVIKLFKVAEKISKFGKKPLLIKADVSKEEETRTIVNRTITEFGKLDVLVNNAGIIRFAGIFDENLLDVYDTIMKTNLRSTVLLTHLAAPHLIVTKGNIINVSSVASTTTGNSGVYGNASYCTSKAGMDHFSRVAAAELAEKGVRVNVVNPGPVETDILDNAGIKISWDLAKEVTPLKVLTKPEEVSNLILYLASDKAKSITGGNYYIDGGSALIG